MSRQLFRLEQQLAHDTDDEIDASADYETESWHQVAASQLWVNY